MNKYIIFLLILFPFIGLSQTQEDKILEQIREQEQVNNAILMRKMDEGVTAMEAGKYKKANDLFKEVLKQAKVVPTELTFYFGKNSYLLDKYKQSIDWLNKYIEIKGTSGRYYEEATALLKNANAQYLDIRKSEQKEAETILTSSYEVDCGPADKVICPVCKGEGVIIEEGVFGKNYRSCPYCDERGMLSCEDYNKLLRGELEPRANQ